MKPRFTGFPKELFKFLRDLEKNNDREWFNANKDRYLSYVVEPVQEFILAMAPCLTAISDRYIADPRRNGGSMFRIYRDTRFSKSKLPYKNNVGCQFRHTAGKDAHAPGFYVHLEPGKIFYGGGVWKPPSSKLGMIRDAIATHPDNWTRIITNRTFRKRFGDIRGDRLTRPPRGFAKDLPLIEDIKRKSFFVMQEDKESAALKPGFITEVERAFKAASPIMEFLTKAVELPY